MIVLDPGEITRVVREPTEVQKERQAEAAAANRARQEEQRQANADKSRMKVGRREGGGEGEEGVIRGCRVGACGRGGVFVVCHKTHLHTHATQLTALASPCQLPQGKNKPSRRQRKKQDNIIEERKPAMKERMREQGVAAEFGHQRRQRDGKEAEVPADVPRALHRFFKK